MKCVMVVSAWLLFASVASAQSPGRMAVGFVYAHPGFENSRLSAGESLEGWLGAVDVPLSGHVGVIARADGTYGERFRQGVVIRPLGTSARAALYTVSGGPRVSVTRGSATVFADGLFGVAHGKARSALIDVLTAIDDTTFVGGGGGGVVVRATRLVDLQLDVQYRRTNLFDQTLNLVQVGAGVSLRLRRP